MKTECLLEYYAEPLATYAWMLGSEYPRPVLQRAWKYLLQNHAHDSICGVARTRFIGRISYGMRGYGRYAIR